MLRRFMRPKKQPEQPSASEAMHPDQDKPTSEPIAEPPAAAEPSQSPKPKKPGLFKHHQKQSKALLRSTRTSDEGRTFFSAKPPGSALKC